MLRVHANPATDAGGEHRGAQYTENLPGRKFLLGRDFRGNHPPSPKDFKQKIAKRNEGLGRPSTETSVSFACSRRRSELPSVNWFRPMERRCPRNTQPSHTTAGRHETTRNRQSEITSQRACDPLSVIFLNPRNPSNPWCCLTTENFKQKITKRAKAQIATEKPWFPSPAREGVRSCLL